MNDLVSQFPHGARPVPPAYPEFDLNEHLELFDGEFWLCSDQICRAGAGKLSVGWFPEAATRFVWHPDEDIPWGSEFLRGSEWTLYVPKYGRSFSCVPVGVHHDFDGHVRTDRVHGVLSGSALSDEHAQVTHLRFPVINFLDYVGESLSSSNENGGTSSIHIWRGRLTIRLNDWEIMLDSPKNLSKTIESLNAEGGYALTQHGKIQRLGCQQFDADSARQILMALNWFLSFCRGSWCGPAVPLGFDASGNEVWREFNVWRVAGWKPHIRSWFSDHHACAHMSAFPGFWRLWKDAEWSESIKLPIHWYLQANLRSGGMEAALVLAYIALEMLASVVCVERQKFVSASGFAQLPGADKIRILLRESGISLILPSELRHLPKIAAEYNWDDGPQAISELRNAITHQTEKKRIKLATVSGSARHEAWQLALHYTELVLLRLFDYNGSYVNRHKARVAGEVESVPWVATGSPSA